MTIFLAYILKFQFCYICIRFESRPTPFFKVGCRGGLNTLKGVDKKHISMKREMAGNLIGYTDCFDEIINGMNEQSCFKSNL